ncbi:chemotaxis protein CheB [Rhodobacterales bacterium HKCCE4037]|nr:chemotaxis protein CheB [Rhodobacterales bacterium HKCCE4037]
MIKVAIVDEVRSRAQRLTDEISHHDRFDAPVWYSTLNEAFVTIEAAPPDIVLVSPGLACRSEYPMFDALLEMLKVRRLYLVGRLGQSDFGGAQAPVRTDAEVREFCASLLHLLGLAPAAMPPKPPTDKSRLVVIGSSTGGIEALLKVLPCFPIDCPPTLIVQHIKADFLPGLVKRLDTACAAQVREAKERDVATPGVVLVAPGNEAHLVLRPSGRRCLLVAEPQESGHRPSVDRLFHSAVPYGPDVVAALLTGMGRDGARGMCAIREAGGWTIAQDEATCVVYGMPQVAKSMGGVCEQLPVDRIGPAILKAATQEMAQSA